MSKYVISSSPHLRDNVSTTSIMRDVCIALLPAAVAGVLFFGYRSAIILALSVAAAVLSEWLYCKAAHCRNTIGDFSAVVTGMLLAMNLPSTVPYWMPVIGSVIAILLCKMIFGGIGQNFINPALAARAILALSWPSLMNTLATPAFGNLAGVDAVASATPIGAAAGTYTLGQLFLGGFQLDSGVFGLGLGPFLLFLLLVLPGLLGVLFLMGGIPAGLVILPQAGGRLFPFLVLPEFPAARWLRANLARGRLPGLTGHFFFGKMEPPTLDPLSGRSVLFVLRANLARSGLTHSAPPFPPGG